MRHPLFHKKIEKTIPPSDPRIGPALRKKVVAAYMNGYAEHAAKWLREHGNTHRGSDAYATKNGLRTEYFKETIHTMARYATLKRSKMSEGEICFKCKKPIQDSQMVAWVGGRAVHEGDCLAAAPPLTTSERIRRIPQHGHPKSFEELGLPPAARMGGKRAYTMTNEGYGQGTVCQKCGQPIADGALVTTEGGMEAHAGTCPTPGQSGGGENSGWQSRLGLPPGYKKPQAPGTPAAQSREINPRIKPASKKGISGSKKLAGQWGVRSYDGDQVHDILDSYRLKGANSRGFDEPVAKRRISSLLRELDKMGSAGENRQPYLGVVAFLATHGTPVPEPHRQRAAVIAGRLLRDRSYLASWGGSARARARELRKEAAILQGRQE